MATISLTLPSDGQTIDASDVNNPFNTIAAEVNGNLDNSNIKAGAAIERSKIAGFTDGWESLGYAPTTITALGNRSYTVLVPSVDTTSATSPGQRLKLPRTVTAPTQCTSLNGTTQYYNDTSVSGMTFTDDFVVSAWVKLSSYQANVLVSRYNGTSGWILASNSAGQITLSGYNGGVGNNSTVSSYQSMPLNKWVHITAQLDMSTFTATTTTSYVMIDGLDIPVSVTRGGTNPTALIQAGNLEIGSQNGGLFSLNGKIAQVAIYSAKVTQATIRASMNQTLTGSETSLVSAYSFNGASGINDLNTTNANNLTAQGSAVATTADTPFTNPVTGTSVTAGTTNYGIITAQTFSTNTTYTVQIPEGETLPTTGGIGIISYSTQKTPYGFPGDAGKWQLLTSCFAGYISGATPTSWQYTRFSLSVPIGGWRLGFNGTFSCSRGGAGTLGGGLTLSTTTSTETDQDLSAMTYISSGTDVIGNQSKSKSLVLAAATPYYLLGRPENDAAYSSIAINAASTVGRGITVITADNSYL